MNIVTKRLIRVLYHCPCPDGGFSALAAHLRFSEEPDVDIKFIPHSTFAAAPIDNTDLFSPESEVYLLDYIGNKIIHPLSKLVKQITLIDHHKTAKEDIDQWTSEGILPSNFKSVIRMDKSGAGLSWEYFNNEKRLISDQVKFDSLKRMVDYVEDNDLWIKTLPSADSFRVGLGEKRIEWDIKKNPALFQQLLHLDTDVLIQEGFEKMGAIAVFVEDDLKNSFKIHLGGYEEVEKKGKFGDCLAVFTKSPHLRSDIGNQLALKSYAQGFRGISALAYRENNMEEGMIKVSLRSIENEDSAIVSKTFGGGGHLNASSFLIKASDFDTWKSNK